MSIIEESGSFNMTDEIKGKLDQIHLIERHGTCIRVEGKPPELTLKPEIELKTRYKRTLKSIKKHLTK